MFIVANTNVVHGSPDETVSWGVIFDYILRAIQYACNWIVGIVDNLSSSLDSLIFSSMPSSLGIDHIITPELMNLINSWIPAVYICRCFFVYWSFAAVVWAFNWILGFVPGES